MAAILALLIIMSQLQCFLSGNTTASPSTTVKAAAGAASKSITATEAPVAAKVRSQKDLLGSFGNFNLTAEKASTKTDTPSKPVINQKSLLGSFGSFAKPKPKPEPKAPPVTASPKPDPQTCTITDMCKTMNGICNKGTCVHVQKNCEADIKCDCDPGYTGQFCSIAIADITESTTKASSTSTKASGKPSKNNGKHHVNGNVDKTKFDTDNVTKTDNGQMVDNSVNRNINSNANGNGKVTDTSVQNKNGNGAESKNTNINGNGSGNISTDKTKASIVEESTISKPKSKNGSYRKGPEAVVVADNSPISIDGIKMKPHKIKTTNMSVIKQTTDTVTFATISVKNTFIGAVNKQTSRLQNGNVGKKIKSNTNKQKKKSKAPTDSRDKKPVTEHSTTPKPTTTTLASQTKKVVIDSSNNMTINVVTNASIKNGKKTAVKETKGSVNLQNKTLDIQPVKIGKNVEREKTKRLNGVVKGKETSQQSIGNQAFNKMIKEISGQARSEAKSLISPNAATSKQLKAVMTKEVGATGNVKTKGSSKSNRNAKSVRQTDGSNNSEKLKPPKLDQTKPNGAKRKFNGNVIANENKGTRESVKTTVPNTQVNSSTQKSKQTELSGVVVKGESKATTANKENKKSSVVADQQNRKQKQTENGQLKQKAAAGKSDVSKGLKVTTNKPANINNKNGVSTENGTNGAHFENKSVFSPIIALLQKSETLEKAHKDAAKSSHADVKVKTVLSTPKTVTTANGSSGANLGGSVPVEKAVPA